MQKNLGDGAWLINSAITAHTLVESATESTMSSGIFKEP